MFEQGDIVRFKNGKSGLMKVEYVNNITRTIQIDYIGEHPMKSYYKSVFFDDVIKDESFSRKKKLNKIIKCSK